MILGKYSMGMGDRFGRQGKAQLGAVMAAGDEGIDLTPVWNKSHREHAIIGTTPADVRAEADNAVAAMKWSGPYMVDADHIGMANVDSFLDSSDFFTLDVADRVGRQDISEDAVHSFVSAHAEYARSIDVPGLNSPLHVTKHDIEAAARAFLPAASEAARIYRHIRDRKGAADFVVEVSMDETGRPQTPVELLFILAALAGEDVPVQTIAPKFSGRFNKGVDYAGDTLLFAEEFKQDLAVIGFAVSEFGLPDNLKISVHSGSDKFSIYGPIREALVEYDAGLHLKTAGTTWLEELIGLAEAGGDGLKMAKCIYAEAYDRIDEMTAPYASVIDIDRSRLPDPETVAGWSGAQYADTLRHNAGTRAYNPNFRQLLHVGYKIAAEMGKEYLEIVDQCETAVSDNVSTNILERHIRRVFPA